jgi:hypothetical protein
MGCCEDIFRAISHRDRVFAGCVMSGRISIPICAAAALLALGIGTGLQATTRPDCLAAPNTSSARGQRWYYRVDLPNRRKCWYLHAPVVHAAAKAPEFHAVSTAADSQVSGSRVDSTQGLKTRKLSSQPQSTSFVSTKPIRQSDARIPQQIDGSTPQVDGSTDAVAAFPSSAAKPIEQSDAASVTQQPQESTLLKPADAVAASPSAAIEQSDAAWVTQTKQRQQGSAQSNPTEALAASPAAIATLRVAAANSSPPHADREALEGGRVTERNKPTADIVRGLSFKPAQMLLLLVLGGAIVVFLISLVIILHHRVTALIDLQLDRDRPKLKLSVGCRTTALEDRK